MYATTFDHLFQEMDNSVEKEGVDIMIYSAGPENYYVEGTLYQG